MFEYNKREKKMSYSSNEQSMVVDQSHVDIPQLNGKINKSELNATIRHKKNIRLSEGLILNSVAEVRFSPVLPPFFEN